MLAVRSMTLIQRADTLALRAKLDELLRVDTDAVLNSPGCDFGFGS
jgi:low affinity Fe/Cu permease